MKREFFIPVFCFAAITQAAELQTSPGNRLDSQALTGRFIALDTDQSEALSEDELAAVDNFDHQLSRFDFDQNGVISFDEFFVFSAAVTSPDPLLTPSVDADLLRSMP